MEHHLAVHMADNLCIECTVHCLAEGSNKAFPVKRFKLSHAWIRFNKDWTTSVLPCYRERH